MLVLPFVTPDTWIAVHDLALKDIPRFARETGPFNVYESFPAPKQKSQLENQNIGAFQIAGSHRDYEEYLLASFAKEWTVSGVVKESFTKRIFEMTERFYSDSFAKQIRLQIDAHNHAVMDRRKSKKAK